MARSVSHAVFGIRHHGPGCAHSLLAALEAYAPSAVLVEGPPDAQAALEQVASAELVPPVALLVHAVDAPGRAVFYPFAVFSPEWQALRYAANRGIPVRFIDLPTSIMLGLQDHAEAEASAAPSDSAPPEAALPEAAAALADDAALREDPVGQLARAAGFAGGEEWWDAQIERRHDPAGLFEAINEAMSALRETATELPAFEARREAHMRSMIRAAQKEGFARIAVVCGAWHAPALATLEAAKRDSDLLKGLPKVKTQATWIPWSHSRLSYRTGYGAGVDSPGWYAHLWTHRQRAHVTWAALAARLLREAGIDASSANVIEVVRLAEAVATLRDLPQPGLGELRLALESVLCAGNSAPLGLIRRRLEIGEELGRVPAGGDQVPLQQDLEREVRRLRLKFSDVRSDLDLDLRKANDLGRSQLLHRLRLLRVEWGTLRASGKGTGTFRESWYLEWAPEFAVRLIEASPFGPTLEAAASGSVREKAALAELPALTALLEQALLARLPDTFAALLSAVDARGAASSDAGLLMDALQPLVRVARYGDVRATEAAHVLPVVRGLFERVLVGLFPACLQLDDAAAAQLITSIERAHGACLLLGDADLLGEWLGVVESLVAPDAVHPRVRGYACRLLVEQERLSMSELGRITSLALSQSVEPARAAQWIEGLLFGQALLLLHRDEVLTTLHEWIAGLSQEVFTRELPLLRRAFASFAAPERRNLARKVKSLGLGLGRGRDSGVAVTSAPVVQLDPARVARVLPTLAHVLGVAHE